MCTCPAVCFCLLPPIAHPSPMTTGKLFVLFSVLTGACCRAFLALTAVHLRAELKHNVVG